MSGFLDPSGSWIGTYEIVRELGRGGMGRVYLARDPGVANRLVALKVILDGTDDDASRIRFLREIRNLGKLRHPSIVRVLAAGEHEGRPYFVMDYVAGRDLARFLDECATLPERDRLLAIVRTMAMVARAVAYAHGQGVIHRDLKLPNVLVSHEDDQPVILDFGIAKYAGDSSLTKAGQSPGTPSYRAPEQLDERLKVRDELIDIWTIGVILYRSVTGRMPFVGSDFVAVSLQILQREIEIPAGFDSPLARLLEPIIRDCLAKDPRCRPQSALEVAQRLEGAVATFERDVQAASPGIDDTTPGRGMMRTSASRPRDRASILAATFGVVSLVLGASVLWLLLGGRGAPPERTEVARPSSAAEPAMRDERAFAGIDPSAATLAIRETPRPAPSIAAPIATLTVGPSRTLSPSPAATPTASANPTPTATPRATSTPTGTPRATSTPTPRPTSARAPSATAMPAEAGAQREAAPPVAAEPRIPAERSMADTHDSAEHPSMGANDVIRVVPFDVESTRRIRFAGSVDDLATKIVDDLVGTLRDDDLHVVVGKSGGASADLIVRGRLLSVDGGDRTTRTMLGGIGVPNGAACLSGDARIETRGGQVLRELSFHPCARFAPFKSGESLLEGHAEDVASDIASAIAEIEEERHPPPPEE